MLKNKIRNFCNKQGVRFKNVGPQKISCDHKQNKWVKGYRCTVIGRGHCMTAKQDKRKMRLANRLWRRTLNTKDTNLLRRFIKKFPDSVYAQLAKARIKEIEGSYKSPALRLRQTGRKSKPRMNTPKKTKSTAQKQTPKRKPAAVASFPKIPAALAKRIKQKCFRPSQPVPGPLSKYMKQLEDQTKRERRDVLRRPHRYRSVQYFYGLVPIQCRAGSSGGYKRSFIPIWVAYQFFGPRCGYATLPSVDAIMVRYKKFKHCKLGNWRSQIVRSKDAPR